MAVCVGPYGRRSGKIGTEFVKIQEIHPHEEI